METISKKKLFAGPVVAAVRELKDIEEVVGSSVSSVFFLTGDILNLKESVKYVQDKGKYAFIHIDLIKGLGKDEMAIEYISKEIKPAGIITTRGNLVSSARKNNLISIQRLFVLDTLSLATGIEQVKASKPDYVEVLPAIIPRVIIELKQELPFPIIAGGLVKTENDVQVILKAGAVAVSSSRKDLWRYRRE
ncbi:MAG: glycerol-3-phosphate responsive antiterminator [Moorellaceae bacterium]